MGLIEFEKPFYSEIAKIAKVEMNIISLIKGITSKEE